MPVLPTVIVGAFVLAIVLLFAFVFIFGGNPPTCTVIPCNALDWEKPAEFLFKVLSSILLPVVTLVLGYYFGTEKAKK